MRSLNLPPDLPALPELGEPVARLVARRVAHVELEALRRHPLTMLDLSGSDLHHRQLRHLRGRPLQVLRLTGCTLIDLESLRQALLAASETDLSARMVVSEVWEERFEFRWETHGEPFDVQDQGPLPAFGVEHQVPVDVSAAERRRRLKEAAELYEVDLRALHGPLDGVAELAGLRELRTLSLSWTPVGDEEVSALSDLPLETLELAGTAVVQPRWPSTVRALDVFGCAVSELPPVADLRLGGIPIGGELSWACVERLALHEVRASGLRLVAPVCRVLTLYNSRLDTLEGLVGLELDQLDLSRCEVDDWSALPRLSARHIRLARSSMTDEALEQLLQVRCEVLDLGLSRVRSIDAVRTGLPEVEVRYAGLLVEEDEA